MNDFDPKDEIERLGVSFYDLDPFLQFMNSFCDGASRVFVCGLPKAGKSTLIEFLRYVKWKDGQMPAIQEVNLNRLARSAKSLADAIWHAPRREDIMMADVVLLVNRAASEIRVSLQKCRWVPLDKLKQKEWRIR